MKLQLYVLRELLAAFAFAVGGMLVLALPGVAVHAVHKLAGVDVGTILLFLPLVFSGLVPFILPLGFLLAVVVTYGRLAADNEWTALRMAGFHPLRMFLPALAVGALLSAATMHLMAEELPEIRRTQKSYLTRALRAKVTSLPPGTTELTLGQFYLSSRFREGDEFIDALLYVPGHGARAPQTVVARGVRFTFPGEELLIHLRDARFVRDLLDVHSGGTVIRVRLDELQTEKEGSYTSNRYLTSDELEAQIDAGLIPPEKVPRTLFEIHHRRATSTTYVMFLLIGAPVGILMRRGTQLGALSIAIGVALLYYLLSMRLSAQLASSAVLPPVIGAWLVNGTGTLIGACLTWRVVRQ